MQNNANFGLPAPKQIPWNKGKLTGAKPPLRQKHVWAIRTKLQIDKRTRDLAIVRRTQSLKISGLSRPVFPSVHRASRLQRCAGTSGEFLLQCWRAVEFEQALADIVGGCSGFRQGAPLTAGNDNLESRARSLDVGHVGPHLSRCGSLSYLGHAATVTLQEG